MKSNQSNSQYSKLISIEYSRMNKVDRLFEDSINLNVITPVYVELLSNVTDRGLQKLHPLELMIDVRLGRSTPKIILNHFISTSHYQRT